MPNWLIWLIAAGGVTSSLLLIWGTLIEPRLIIEEKHGVEIPALPAAWENQRIALIADPQIGLWFSNTGTVRRIVARLVKSRPAAVFIAGDFIYQARPSAGQQNEPDTSKLVATRERALEDIERVVRILRPLTDAGLPTYAVLGNHDHASDAARSAHLPSLAARVREALESVGIRVLVNEAVPLPSPRTDDATHPRDADLWLVGLAARSANDNGTRAALAQLPPGAPRLVLMHNPDTFESLPPATAPLAMAGHTHGGQIRTPGLVLRRLLGRFNPERPELSGWIHDYGQPGNRLYVNRGIGFSLLPIRFNAPPEITLFTLRHQANARPPSISSM